MFMQEPKSLRGKVAAANHITLPGARSLHQTLC